MGLNPIQLLSLQEEIWTHRAPRVACTQRKEHMRTQRGGSHLQAKRDRASAEHCHYRDLGLTAPRTERKSCRLSHLVCGTLFW